MADYFDDINCCISAVFAQFGGRKRHSYKDCMYIACKNNAEAFAQREKTRSDQLISRSVLPLLRHVWRPQNNLCTN